MTARRGRSRRSPDELPDCDSCPLCVNHGRSYGGKWYVPNEVKPGVPLVFVGMAPGAEEKAQGRPFAPRTKGRRPNAGSVLARAFTTLGIHRSSCSLLNVVACVVHDNEWSTAGPKAVKACAPLFRSDLERADPRLVVSLGAEPLKVLDPSARGRKLGRLRGYARELPDGSKCMPTYHPAYFLREQDPSQFKD